jgi:outer membrane receptor protein involved in Fe transport
VSSGLLSRLNLSLDYFNITINDPIGNSGGGGVLLHCVSPEFNPAAAGVAGGATNAAGLDDPAVRAAANAAILQGSCPDVFRTATNPAANQFGGFNGAKVVTTFDNDGKIELSGLDANLSWSTDVGPGTMFVNLNGNYMFHFKVQPFTGTPMLDYVGTTGTGLKGVNFGSSFRWKLFGVLGYTWGGLSASLQWQHTPPTDDACNVAFKNGLTTTPCAFSGLPAYDLFNFNSSYQVTDSLSVRFGVDNLFNREPAVTGVNTNADPSLGQLPGGSFTFFQDVQGRRFTLGANVKF